MHWAQRLSAEEEEEEAGGGERLCELLELLELEEVEESSLGGLWEDAAGRLPV